MTTESILARVKSRKVLVEGEPLFRRLDEAATELKRLEKHIARQRYRRNLLIAKLRNKGYSTRTIGLVAKISSPAITQISRRKSWEDKT